MRYRISGKNLELTDGMRQAVEEHMDRLGKYFQPDTEVNITMRVDKKP